MVIVAAHVAHMLERIVGPALHAHLSMLDAACDTELHILLVACNAVHETCILATERSADCITDIIAECADLVEHMSVGFERDLLCRECRSLSSPAFAVDHDCRVDGMKTLADDIHCLDVMDGHEVETKTVDMIFLHPPLERLDHIFAEHLTLRCSFVAASRAVEICSVRTHTVEISRHGSLETCLRGISRMVVDHVKNHSEACCMKSLDHLLELLDTGHRIERIS